MSSNIAGWSCAGRMNSRVAAGPAVSNATATTVKPLSRFSA
jgi:hypothetical protein